MKRKPWLWIAVAAVMLAAAVAAVLLLAREKDEQDRAQMVAEYRAAKRQQYELENGQYADYEVEVAFLGDSLTDGYDLARYYPQYVTANRGIGGDTSLDLEGRLQVSLYDLKPKVAVMLIGGNNPGTMLDNYESILRGFRDNVPDTRIILLSLTCMSGDWGVHNEDAKRNNLWIRMLAEAYGFTFVDVYDPMQDPQTGEIRPEYTVDGGHLTEEGYDVLTALITPVITEQLELWHQEHP